MTSKGSHMNRDLSLKMHSSAYKLFLKFKTALCSIALVMKPFNNSRKLF